MLSFLNHSAKSMALYPWVSERTFLLTPNSLTQVYTQFAQLWQTALKNQYFKSPRRFLVGACLMHNLSVPDGPRGKGIAAFT